MSHINCPITQMKSWVANIIVKYNFCPFARKEVENNSIHYHVSNTLNIENAVLEMINQCIFLNENQDIETTLLILDQGFSDFNDFLDLVDLANALLIAQGFEGQYQIATFHPDYVFADSEESDAANYTNRAPFPTLHIIREASMAEALKSYDDPDSIPENNIQLTRRKGIDFWQKLLENCHKS